MEDGEERPEEGAFRVELEWRDLIFLFHALQVSKPILHHRTTSSRIATDATIFTEIDKLTWSIFRLEMARCERSSSSSAAAVNPPAGFHHHRPAMEFAKYLTDKVAQILTFGGKQVHAREWKALLLMDFAFFWMEEAERTRFTTTAEGELDNISSATWLSKDSIAQLLLLAVFQTVSKR